MPQLRDAKTSELLAEGTPLEIVQAADAAGLNAGVVKEPGDVDGLDAIYDDVGLEFDPAAVLKAHEENVAGHQAVAKDTKAKKADRDQARDRVDQLKAEAEAGKGMAADVTKRREKAHARIR